MTTTANNTKNDDTMVVEDNFRQEVPQTGCENNKEINNSKVQDACAKEAEDNFSPVEISKEELKQFISSVTELVKEKEALENEKKEIENKLLRLQADFDNFRKRTRQEREEAQRFANQELLLSFLPIMDNLERALSTKEDSSGFKEGIDMIYRQFMNNLKQFGVEEIVAINTPFDPTLHEAVMQEQVADDKKGLVLMEIQKGYTLHGRLLRPSMVQVGV
ncbi:MAG: nucleotide exchange factor GrpE [Bacillota bacterium]|jgi:molecular chaperone GrpE